MTDNSRWHSIKPHIQRAVAVAAVAILALVGYGAVQQWRDDRAAEQAAAEARGQVILDATTDRTVEYQVDGSALAIDIARTERGGEVRTIESHEPPYTHTTTGVLGSRLHIVAQVVSGAGTVSCSIKVDGKVVASDQAAGAGQMVECEAVIG